MDKFRAIVVDDEASVCEAVKAILETEGIEAVSTTNSLAAVEDIKRNNYDLIISDLKMPKLDGLGLYDQIKDAAPDSVFMIITAFGTIPSAVDAIKKGIYDYIPKPFTPDEVRIPVRRALEKRKLEHENRVLRSQIETRYSFQNIIGNSQELREVFRVMRHAASSESNVLITGESGTGKELIARAIHRWSPRDEQAFMTINCSAIPDTLLESELFGFEKGAFTGAQYMKKGLLEQSDGGTVFFDEIGDVSPLFQTKILRVLQEGEIMRIGALRHLKVDLRFIAATNRDLQTACQRGAFREDLYYRLNVINIHLPPLRERMEDVPHLAKHFIKEHAPKRKDILIKGITAEAMKILMSHLYPGNVRELENIMERSISFANTSEILPADLPAGLLQAPVKPRSATTRLRESLSTFEKETIASALIEFNGNISRAASSLGVYRQHLQRKIKQYKIAT
jgi:DNA-binding NtrC family response regulator